eukprot:Opistho-2@14546
MVHLFPHFNYVQRLKKSKMELRSKMSPPDVASFSSLPPEIIVHHVAPFLDNVDLSSLSKVNSSLHTHLRHKRIYHMWPMYNRMYVEDAKFRDEVRATIPVGRIALFWDDNSLRDLSAFEGVHSATCPDEWANDPDSYNTIDLSPLKGVHTVKLFPPVRITCQLGATRRCAGCSHQ